MPNPYPAKITDDSGVGVLTGEIDFSDPGNQPGGGGSQPGNAKIADIVFNEPDPAVPYAIIAVNQGTPSVTIDGDHVSGFPVNTLGNNPSFAITGSTGNDGQYSVVSATLAGGDTVIAVLEPLADATVDGFVSQSLVAAWEIPAGATIIDIHMIPLAAPWADTPVITVGDSVTPEGYYSCDGDVLQSFAYDPTSVTPGQNFVNMKYGGQIYSSATFLPNSTAAAGGGGVLYPTGDTLSLVVLGINTGGAGGQLLARIIYLDAIDPVIAA